MDNITIHCVGVDKDCINVVTAKSLDVASYIISKIFCFVFYITCLLYDDDNYACNHNILLQDVFYISLQS